ncbi:phage tail assembly chaperone G [Staphylococcus aureus]|uniref:phage tail assembly chaperone G n=1 Tax=Staphylococcus aureus TaxID=1280 RepID=UPI003D2F370D
MQRRCNNGRSRKCYEYLELVNQENKKKHLTQQNETKERQLLVDLFKDEGLTEEDVLNKMSTKTYTKPYKIYSRINGEDEEDSETEPEEMGKTEEQSQ